METVTRTADRRQSDMLASAVAGDEVAFRRIIVARDDDMRRVCLAISGDHAIAEDALRAAWLVALEEARQGPESRPPPSLAGIGRGQ